MNSTCLENGFQRAFSYDFSFTIDVGVIAFIAEPLGNVGCLATHSLREFFVKSVAFWIEHEHAVTNARCRCESASANAFACL